MPAEPTPMAPLEAIEALDERILTLCTHLNAATYELLVMIREFDERGGCLKWGLENTATWLAWRCDLTMATAREKLRVAVFSSPHFRQPPRSSNSRIITSSS